MFTVGEAAYVASGRGYIREPPAPAAQFCYKPKTSLNIFYISPNRCFLIDSLIQRFHRYLMTAYYVPGTVLKLEDKAGNKTHPVPICREIIRKADTSRCICGVDSTKYHEEKLSIFKAWKVMWVVRNVLEDFQVSRPLDIFNKTGFQGRPLWGGELWQTLGRKVWEAEPGRDLRTERFRQESKGPEARTGWLPLKNSREAQEPAALWDTWEHGHERKSRSHGPWSEGWRCWFYFDCDRKPLDYEWLWAQKKKKKMWPHLDNRGQE